MVSISHTWLPYLYLYGAGGILFFTGMIIIRKSGALNLTKKRHRQWRMILLFGFLYFMILHAFFTIAALYW